jgi:hypothetical protein
MVYNTHLVKTPFEQLEVVKYETFATSWSVRDAEGRLLLASASDLVDSSQFYAVVTFYIRLNWPKSALVGE